MKDPSGFLMDMSVPGMIHAITIRSPVAKGRLIEIKSPKLPSACSLITAKHIPGENRLAGFPIILLADNKLSYIGQPIAILTGPEESVLEDISASIKINAEEEAPEFSIRETQPENRIAARDLISGDPFKPLGEDGIIVSGTYKTGIQEHWYPEPHGALAVPYFEKGKKAVKSFIVYTATQWPFHVRHSLSTALGFDPKKIIVSPSQMSFHMDGKLLYPSLIACHAALASFIAKKPCKLMLSRKEDFLYSPKRNKTEIEICSALGENGIINSSIVEIKLDLGSQSAFEDELIDHTCLGAMGAYNHNSFKIEAAALSTNIPPQGPMAGFGLSQGLFAAELHFSRIADSIGMDPAEWRKNNCLAKNQNFAAGFPLKEQSPLVKLIDAAAFMSDYYRKWASYEHSKKRRRAEKWEYNGIPWRGIGLSTAFQGSGLLYNSDPGCSGITVEVTLEKDGHLEIKTSVISSADRYQNTWKKIAFDILGVNPSFVRFTADTENAPDSGPGTLSRNISIISKLLERCCTVIRKQRFRSPLPITVRRSLKTAMTTVSGCISAKNMDTEVFSHPCWGAAVSEIEINPETFKPDIRGIWLVVDGGKILNEHRARRTLQTAVIQALGWACHESISYEAGKIPDESYNCFNIPAPEEIPPVEVDFLHSSSPASKGIGDLPFSCVPAAYIQAVSQAMDHHFERIPLETSHIWEIWKSKRSEPPK